MTPLVVDASVALKWFLQGRPDEADAERAVAVLLAVRDGKAALIQPPHWRAEIAAVLCRASPATLEADLADLADLRALVVDSPALLQAAATLAVDTGQHLFDTLYHAVALQTEGGTLVTADEAYFRKARRYGQIALLAGFDPGSA